MARRRRPQQIALPFRPHGGRRRGAGRKPRGARPLVSHGTRGPLSGREPVLVTMKVLPRVWNLRARSVFARIVPALFAARERLGCRLVHFSVQRDHLHLVVEAADPRSLSRAMQGLAVRIARRVNRMMKRRGKVFADRFHERVLRTPRQVRNALQYVLGNARKHGVQPRGCRFDPCSSAAAFEGWSIAAALDPSPVVSAPRTWLLACGWKRAGGLLDPTHRPGPWPR